MSETNERVVTTREALLEVATVALEGTQLVFIGESEEPNDDQRQTLATVQQLLDGIITIVTQAKGLDDVHTV